MAKKIKRTKSTQTGRGTNWYVIGGVIVVGAIILFGLLYLATREPETQTLSQFCDAADGNCVIEGTNDAPVTLVEISDFGCTHCRAFHQETVSTLKEEYVDTGLVRWVVMPYALSSATVPASNAALCANEQGKFFEFSDALFNVEPADQVLLRDTYIQLGQEIGLEGASFEQCLAEGRYNNKISTNQQAASQAGVNSTPTFFVNDQIIRGNVPIEEFENRINQQLNS
jgi:protein-disulfide isomerase